MVVIQKLKEAETTEQDSLLPNASESKEVLSVPEALSTKKEAAQIDKSFSVSDEEISSLSQKPEEEEFVNPFADEEFCFDPPRGNGDALKPEETVPTHVSGVPFVLIPEEAKEDFQKELLTKLTFAFANGRRLEVDVNYPVIDPGLTDQKHLEEDQVVDKQGLDPLNSSQVTGLELRPLLPILLEEDPSVTSGVCFRRGLINPKCSCFLNASLQALLSCSLFVQFIQGLQKDIQKAEFPPTIAAFSEFMIESCGPSRSSFLPSMFDMILQNFSPDGRQQDVPAFLTYILNRLNGELSQLGRTQSFSDIFFWKLAGNNEQPFLVSPLPINLKEVSNIEHALQVFFEKTGGVVSATTTESLKIKKTSDIMILQLMRFDYEKGQNVITKVQKRIDFPVELNLGGYVLVSPANDKGFKYELVATITHHGTSPSCGHYTTNARRNNGQWLKFDDAVVTEIGTEEVLDGKAYVLFYKRVIDPRLANQKHLEEDQVVDKQGLDPLNSSQVTGLELHPLLPILLVCLKEGSIKLDHYDRQTKKHSVEECKFSIWELDRLSQPLQEHFAKLKNQTEGALCVSWGCLQNMTLYGVGFKEGLVHVYKYQEDYHTHRHLEIEAHIGSVNSLAFCAHEDRVLILTCGDDRHIKAWDGSKPTRSLLWSYCHVQSVNVIAACSQPGPSLPVFFSDVCGITKRIIIKIGKDSDSFSSRIISIRHTTLDSRTELKLSSDGKRLFTCSTGEFPVLLELNTATLRIERVFEGVETAHFKGMDVCEKFIGLQCEKDKYIKLWKLDDPKLYTKIERLTFPDGAIIGFNQEGSLLAVAWDSNISMMELAENLGS